MDGGPYSTLLHRTMPEEISELAERGAEVLERVARP